jgi:hypothetical protein
VLRAEFAKMGADAVFAFQVSAALDDCHRAAAR